MKIDPPDFITLQILPQFKAMKLACIMMISGSVDVITCQSGQRKQHIDIKLCLLIEQFFHESILRRYSLMQNSSEKEE